MVKNQNFSILPDILVVCNMSIASDFCLLSNGILQQCNIAQWGMQLVEMMYKNTGFMMMSTNYGNEINAVCLEHTALYAQMYMPGY